MNRDICLEFCLMTKPSFSLLKVQGFYLLTASSAALVFLYRETDVSRAFLFCFSGLIFLSLILLYTAFREIQMPRVLPFVLSLTLVIGGIYAYRHAMIPRVLLADAFTEIVIAACWLQIFFRHSKDEKK